MSEALIFETLKSAISSGSAVLLVGAGFARSGRDSLGGALPSTDELVAEIKLALEIPIDEQASLSDIAEFAADTPEETQKLRTLLMQRLVTTQPSDDQRTLLTLPWRAIFTTNFDDIVERAVTDATHAPVTPASPANAVPAGKTPIYYLHGRARDFLEKATDPSLVISESNYLSLDRKNRELYARLYNEVFSARAVSIIGYSLRDLEIAQGLLNQGSAFSEKTVIVCANADGAVAQRRLRKFGNVAAIGVGGIAHELRGMKASPSYGAGRFQFLREATISAPAAAEIVSDDFVNLLLRGELDIAKFARQRGTSGSEPAFCVDRREYYDVVLDTAEGHVRRFIVTGDFGNGKSIFVEQLAAAAIQRGQRVLQVDTKLPEIFLEIDAAIKDGGRFVFILDDVVRYREVARYIGARLHNNITLVCTTRGEQDDRAYEVIEKELGGAVRHVDLNNLTDGEIEQWDGLLERWGFWGQRIELSASDRKSFIRDRCARENRALVLSLFRESELAHRIDRIVDFFLRDTRDHVQSFAALLISSLCQQHVTWQSLVAWLQINESRLRRDIENSEIKGIFEGGRNWNAFTSPQLAEFILRNRFVATDRDVLVSVYSTIVLRTADSANDARSGLDFRENLKELMKFRFLTRLFGDDEDAIRLVGNVYHKLSDARRIRDNPQFWLQYAMSRMEIDDLDAAQRYLETAIGLAKERGKEYSPFQILDQRARLYLRKSVISAKNFNRAEVRQAVTDLSELSQHKDYEIVYPFRAVPALRDVLNRWIDEIDADTRRLIAIFLAGLKSTSAGMQKLPRSQKGETKVLFDALLEAELVLRNG